MEAYAFSKVVNAIIDVGIIIASITTDRHKTIRKILREKYPDILHQFDFWHFAKNISKQLRAKAKLKRHSSLQPWIRSIINHFWWSCSTCGEDEEVLREKWVSLLNHVSNEHEWEGFSKVPSLPSWSISTKKEVDPQRLPHSRSFKSHCP